jgi:hypothetical protein
MLIMSQIPEQDREYVNRRLLEEYQCYPVYLSDELADRHYNGELRAGRARRRNSSWESLTTTQGSPTRSSGRSSTTTQER